MIILSCLSKMNLRTSAALFFTSVLIFSILYYFATLQADDLGLRGSGKLETVANCVYESVMVSSFGSPKSPPASTTGAIMIVMNRMVTLALVFMVVFVNIRQTNVSMS